MLRPNVPTTGILPSPGHSVSCFFKTQTCGCCAFKNWQHQPSRCAKPTPTAVQRPTNKLGRIPRQVVADIQGCSERQQHSEDARSTNVTRRGGEKTGYVRGGNAPEPPSLENNQSNPECMIQATAKTLLSRILRSLKPRLQRKRSWLAWPFWSWEQGNPRRRNRGCCFPIRRHRRPLPLAFFQSRG